MAFPFLNKVYPDVWQWENDKWKLQWKVQVSEDTREQPCDFEVHYHTMFQANLNSNQLVWGEHLNKSFMMLKISKSGDVYTNPSGKKHAIVPVSKSNSCDFNPPGKMGENQSTRMNLWSGSCLTWPKNPPKVQHPVGILIQYSMWVFAHLPCSKLSIWTPSTNEQENALSLIDWDMVGISLHFRRSKSALTTAVDKFEEGDHTQLQ